jgi:gliding motility-associated-like protein/uncharacterized repeat protein (TIGR01451 family)
MKKSFLIIVLYFLTGGLSYAQICGSPGIDGAANVSASVNTYYPPATSATIPESGRSVMLGAVPATDAYNNSFGNKQIKAGDMLLIIQMQDAQINYANAVQYGAGIPNSGPDGLGGTGYEYINNTGYFEYAIATNDVPLTGGTLTFRAAGLNKGTVHAYFNQPATATRGKETFQIVRVPQYSNLLLTTDISTPPFNGSVGGIVAFDVSGSMNFNGRKIDASSKGFRGGYGLQAGSGINVTDVYAVLSSSTQSSGKGESIAGTPKFMWDGYNEVSLPEEGLPRGAFGRGAPANGGGGGNDHNAGGGGGGNGGYGGVGGNGVVTLGGTYPNGGRPGSITYQNTPDFTRLIMGGGGGGGDANNALSGVKGGVGGGLVLINVGSITGEGIILANGGNGEIGAVGSAPDGAGGGGGGGTVFLKVSQPDASSTLTIEAKGGNGGDTPTDSQGNKHGTGGGGGGGLVFFSMPQTAGISINVLGGRAGNTPPNSGETNGAQGGTNGKSIHYEIPELPAYLQSGGASCYPVLNTAIKVAQPGSNVFLGDKIEYTIQISNIPGVGNAGGVFAEAVLSPNLTYENATASITGETTITGVNTSNVVKNGRLNVRSGPFNIPAGETVTVKLTLTVACDAPIGQLNASALGLYLDPTRTAADPDRLITAKANAWPSEKTTYESNDSPVPGNNYDGDISPDEDIKVVALPAISSNSIVLAQTVFCDTGDAPVIKGSAPSGGNSVYQYQWQSSTNGTTFNNIPNAIAIDYDPPQSGTSVFYRRIVISSCNLESESNVIKVVVGPSPIAEFQTPDICLADASATFINNSTISDGSNLQYLWDFGDPASGPNNTSNEKDGRHNYHQAKAYQIKLTVTSELTGCSTVIEKTFTVNGSIPKADFEVINLNSLCTDAGVQFKDLASVDFGEITKIEWYFDYDNHPLEKETDEAPALRSETEKIYTHIYPEFHSPVTKTVKVRMIAYSGQSCMAIKDQTITLKASPQISFDVVPDVCVNDIPFLITHAKENTGLPGRAIFSGNGVRSDGLFSPSIAGEGDHIINYEFISDNGCRKALQQTIKVFANPKISLNHLETILVGGSVALNPIVSGTELSYNWFPVEGLSASTIPNPIATPSKNTNYHLIVTNKFGCTAEDSAMVRVLETPEIPNVFTPNGDEINDTWNIKYLESYPSPMLTIYNRYGDIVYQNIYIKGWDGKKGNQDLPEGAYYYIINISEKKLKYSGSVTIVR